MDKIPGLGELELEVLRHFTEHGPLTVGEAAAHFGGERGSARSTIQTIMDRLCRKKLLERHEAGGVFVYSAAKASEQVPAQLVKDFVSRTLGGNLSPLIAFLAESKGLTEAEAAILERLAEPEESK